MKINEAKIIMFTLVTIILFCAVLIGYQIPKQQVKMKQNQIEDLQEEQRILRDKNGELNKLVKRQSKTVISDEEKQIREVSSNFVKQMFEMKKDSSFKSKAPQIKPLVTKDYYDTLFKDSKDKYDLYDDITVNDIHVYFDTYDPKKIVIKFLFSSTNVLKQMEMIKLNIVKHLHNWI